MLEKREKWGNIKSEAEGKMMEQKNFRKKILNSYFRKDGFWNLLIINLTNFEQK